MSLQNPNQLAVLWDIENIQPGDETFLLEDLMEYLNDLGKLVIKRVYADWIRINRDVSFQLTAYGFEMLHIPHKENQKNSADILMTTDATLLLNQYPWINQYVFITNDRDFRGLFQAITKHGKQIILICLPKKISNELVQLVDIVKDYNDFNNMNEQSSEEQIRNENLNDDNDLSREKAKELLLDKLVEAIHFLREIRHSANDFSPFTQGDVLVRLKMVYPEYQQAVNVLIRAGVLHKQKWFSSLLRLAEKKRIIRLELYGATYHINLASAVPTTTTKLREKYFNLVLKVIREKGTHDKIDLSKLASSLGKHNTINYKDLGYQQFKNALLDMQDRSLIKLQRKKDSNAWDVVRLV